ncbi:MAG: glycosyltransferase family 39 protein [Acidobacteriota bacterium]|nr:glycosyltransferase family 39 protein [Acidobacteriota bacterium]
MWIRLARRGLPGLAALALATALAITHTGGGTLTVGPIRLSLHDAGRPLLLGLLALGLYLALFFRTVPSDLARMSRAFLRRRWALALLLVGLTVAAAWHWGTFAAGGDDSCGYVTQAHDWLRGALVFDQQSVAKGLHWSNLDWTFTPLGATTGPAPYTTAPKYPPGLPLLMAAATAVAGPQGTYAVVPLAGGLAVGLTFLLGSLLFDETTGLVAALLLALSPAFLYQLVSPMSDVPAAAAWTLALVFALLRRPAAAGLAAGLAIAIRPNLAPLVLPLALLTWPREAGQAWFTRDAWRTLLWLAAGTLPGVVVVAWFNLEAYGAPWRSGYGALGNLYALSHILPNLASYSRWLVETETPLVAAAVLPFLWRASRPHGPLQQSNVRAGLGLFLALLLGSYLVFLPFGAWWYLRYLLPGLPLLLVLASGGIQQLLRRAGPVPGAVLLLLVVVAAGCYEGLMAADRGVFRLHVQERHYVTVGEDLARLTPPNAVFLSMQESCSIRLYAHRWTLRWDWLEPQDLDKALAALQARGLHPYLLLEGFEEQEFRSRFPGQKTLGLLDGRPRHAWTNPIVTLYDSEDRK